MVAHPAAVRPTIVAAMHSCKGAHSLLSSHLKRVPASPRIQAAGISTTTSLLRRHKFPGARVNRDANKTRGESAIRRTGTRWRLSVSDEPLPRPVKPENLPTLETDPNHGLWEFFADRLTVASPPEEDAKHGRGWTVEELRAKSWDDLHRLWWVCVKERNRIATARWERKRSQLGFGDAEADSRDAEVRITMRGIKHVLTERHYVWEDAVKLAEQDPEIDISGDGVVFTPMEYLEEAEEAAEEQQLSSDPEPVAADPGTPSLPDTKAQREAPRL